MKISARDKMLLYVVGSILIVFLSYYFGFRRFTAMTADVNAEIDELKVRYDDLTAKKADAKKYELDAAAYDALYEVMLANYDSGFSQKATLLFTTEMEAELDVWLRTVNMPAATQIYTFGNVTSTNPTTAGAQVYTTDLTGYRKSTTYSYECGYDVFKEMLDYVLNYDTRYTVDSITCTYSADEELMSGTFTVSQYAVLGKDREYYEPDIDSIMTGTENLFVSVTNPNRVIESEDGFGMMTNYDIALSLSSEASDLSSVVLGRRGLVSSQLSANTNDNVDVSIVVQGEGGVYSLSYTVGDSAYPANPDPLLGGVVFNPGRSLDFIVFSSKREGAEDTAGARVSIINNSDMTMNIKVLNDDETAPRFNIERTEGDIRFYR